MTENLPNFPEQPFKRIKLFKEPLPSQDELITAAKNREALREDIFNTTTRYVQGLRDIAIEKELFGNSKNRAISFTLEEQVNNVDTAREGRLRYKMVNEKIGSFQVCLKDFSMSIRTRGYKKFSPIGKLQMNFGEDSTLTKISFWWGSDSHPYSDPATLPYIASKELNGRADAISALSSSHLSEYIQENSHDLGTKELWEKATTLQAKGLSFVPIEDREQPMEWILHRDHFYNPDISYRFDAFRNSFNPIGVKKHKDVLLTKPLPAKDAIDIIDGVLQFIPTET